MYLKERIDQALKELNEKYQPKAEAKEEARPLLEEIYDIKLSNQQIGDLIRRIESVYEAYVPESQRKYAPWNIS